MAFGIAFWLDSNGLWLNGNYSQGKMLMWLHSIEAYRWKYDLSELTMFANTLFKRDIEFTIPKKEDGKLPQRNEK
jgi:hypothetical protein